MIMLLLLRCFIDLVADCEENQSQVTKFTNIN